MLSFGDVMWTLKQVEIQGNVCVSTTYMDVEYKKIIFF